MKLKKPLTYLGLAVLSGFITYFVGCERTLFYTGNAFHKSMIVGRYVDKTVSVLDNYAREGDFEINDRFISRKMVYPKDLLIHMYEQNLDLTDFKNQKTEEMEYLIEIMKTERDVIEHSMNFRE